MASLEYQTFQFHSVGSSPIELDIVRDTAATTSPSAPQKTLVFFHGGGLVSGSRRSRFPGLPLVLLMRRGWTVITADYRLLPESSVADMIDDVKHLETWLVTEGTKLGVDLGFIAVSGASAGSFLSVLALSSWTTIRPRAFFSLYGMLNTSSSWYGEKKSDSVDFVGLPAKVLHAEYSEPYLTPGNPPVWHDDSDADPADPKNRLRLFLWLLKEGKLAAIATPSIQAATGKNTPLELITSSFPPTLAVHGTADTVVPVEDSRLLQAALAKAGVKNRLIEVEGADHGIAQDRFAGDVEKSVDVFEEYFNNA